MKKSVCKKKGMKKSIVVLIILAKTTSGNIHIEVLKKSYFDWKLGIVRTNVVRSFVYMGKIGVQKKGKPILPEDVVMMG